MKQLRVGFQAEPQAWARQQWAQVKLADNRLERRALELGYRMTLAPSASLPKQMADPATLKAAYRFLSNRRVSHGALSQVHWQSTQKMARGRACVLLVQDSSELDYTHYAQTMVGLGSVGDRRFNYGLLLHTTLGILPEPRRVLGIMHQQVVRRQLIPEGTGHRQRPKAGAGSQRRRFP